MREISDEICKEHKLSVIAEPEKGMGISHYERDMQNEGKSWKEKLRHKLAKAIMKSFSFEDFCLSPVVCALISQELEVSI